MKIRFQAIGIAAVGVVAGIVLFNTIDGFSSGNVKKFLNGTLIR